MQNERIVLRSHIKVPEKKKYFSKHIKYSWLHEEESKSQFREEDPKLVGLPRNCHQIVIQILLISRHPLQTNEKSTNTKFQIW